MHKTKIEWCDSTWNPISGCLHGCPYCYARRTANRFAGCDDPPKGADGLPIIDLEHPLSVTGGRGKIRCAPYPFGFKPTFHRYRLDQPQKWKDPQTIFVCSMADLFGAWVPDEWIFKVFEACHKAPQHRYLFLTKNPTRYMELASNGLLPEDSNFWYGSTITGPDVPFWWSDHHNTFVSIEPMLEEFPPSEETAEKVGWVILGAMTGPGSKGHQPKREWVKGIVAAADGAGVPVFMKDSLIPIIKEENMRREFPWPTKTLRNWYASSTPCAGSWSSGRSNGQS